MSKSTILFVGFSKPTYVRATRVLFPPDQYDLVCIHGRQPSTYHQEKYFPLFDEVYHTSVIPDDLAKRTIAITCTQERDITTYIRCMREFSFIDDSTHSLWTQLVDKQQFKMKLAQTLPELVPAVSDFDFDSEHDISYPAVIKPTNFTGSSFVHILRNEADLATFRASFQKTMDPQKIIPKLIVEEFIVGPQYSLNIYVNKQGAITFCPLIRVIPAFELKQNDTYSAIQHTTTVENEARESLYRAIESIVETFHIRNTSAHFDCMHAASGWKICEAGLRIGGLRQEIFAASYGFSHIQNDLANRVGFPISLGAYQQTFAIVQKTTGSFSYIKEITYTHPQASDVTLVIKKQYANKPMIGPVSLGGQTAFRAFLTHPDEAIAVQAAHDLYKSITFITNDGAPATPHNNP